jgi:alpha-L-arabinofuranosidase
MRIAMKNTRVNCLLSIVIALGCGAIAGRAEMLDASPVQARISPAGGVFGAGMVQAQVPAVSVPEAAVNLVPNASFEEVANNRPRRWRSERWAGEGTASLGAEGRTGGRSVTVASDRGADMGWAATVPLEPYGRYRLSGWIKTDGVVAGTGRGALFNVHDLQPAATPAVTGTQDWTRVETVFEVHDQHSIQVNCLLGGWGQSTGKAWFDDVRLERIGSLPVPAPRMTIDAGQVREPMSVNIYSQFIEHLGRCIYGGIWAEMLEDRKFYFPITTEYNPYRALRDTAYPVVGASPWEMVGWPGSVNMRTIEPFVGRHTPEIQAGSAIRQRDLGVTAGQTYEGHVWLRRVGGDRSAVEMTLRWGEDDAAQQSVQFERVGNAYGRFTFKFAAGATTDRASLELRVREGTVLVGTISLMPANHVEGLRADTLALLRELDAPIYRWPGGNFVSGYDWRDGVGDRDRRPPRTNPAWTGVEHNDFGMHEFIRFCELVEAEPWITVNTGFGDAYSAAAQLEYCNGAANTLNGRLRAANGVREPFEVKYWGIGNEMWGAWQLGYMALEHYILKQNWVVDKMREVDPDIICISSGNAGPWSTGLLKGSADHMDYIAEHFYSQERPGLMAHVRQIPDNIRGKAEFHRKARQEIPGLEGKDIRISMTEWNYWYGPHAFGELGTRYYLKDALGIAAGLHEYARQSDIIESAFYAQTVNVIGCIKTSRRNAAFETTGLVLKLYRQHFGELPVATTTEGLIDAQAAWSRDRKTLTIGIVNATLQTVDLPLELRGVQLKGTGTRWQIAGSDPMAFNDPEESPRVRIEEEAVSGVGERLRLAPCSVTLFALETE